MMARIFSLIPNRRLGIRFIALQCIPDDEGEHLDKLKIDIQGSGSIMKLADAQVRCKNPESIVQPH
jgi:hypothetical protein